MVAKKTNEIPAPPLQATAVVESPYTVEYAERVRELQRLQRENSDEFAEAAKAAHVKITQGVSLDDVFRAIVAYEFRESGKDIYPEGASPEEIAARTAIHPPESKGGEIFQDWAGRARTGKNGDKVRTNDNGEIIK